MKFLLVIACFFMAVNAVDKKFVEELKQKMQEIGAKCVEEEGPNDDDIALLIGHQMPVTHEGKCVIACVYKAFNTINDDATINVEGGIAALEPLKQNDEELYGKIVTIFKKCAGTVKIDGDRCNTGANLIQCCVTEAKSMGLNQDDFI